MIKEDNPFGRNIEMVEGLLFANARAKAKEQNLLSDERLKRMIEAKSLEDAVRILYEVNYAGGMIVKPEDFQALLREEEKVLGQFIKEVANDEMGLMCFFLKNDYHNAKVVMKEKYGSIKNANSLFLSEAMTSVAKLREQVFHGKDLDNEHLKRAIQNIEEAFVKGHGSPRIIDIEMDRAMYGDILTRLSKVGDKYIKNYFLFQIDCTNVLSLLRTMKIEKNYLFFEGNFIAGGSLGKDFFDKIGMDKEKLQREISRTDLAILFERVKDNNLTLLEVEIDNLLLENFQRDKADMFSSAPIIGYYLGKMNEIKVVRVVLVCQKNNVSKEEMKKRIRNLYF